MGNLIAKLLLWLGPKGLEFGRYSIDYHNIRCWKSIGALSSPEELSGSKEPTLVLHIRLRLLPCTKPSWELHGDPLQCSIVGYLRTVRANFRILGWLYT